MLPASEITKYIKSYEKDEAQKAEAAKKEKERKQILSFLSLTREINLFKTNKKKL